MLDHAQATTASTSLAADRTDRDLQRAALHELVMLSTECAATEAQLEHDRAAAIEQAKRDLEKSISAIEGDYETTRTSLQQKHQQRHAEAGRQRADMDAEAAEHEIKQKLDQAIWLAESLYDGTHARAHEDYRKAKEALKAHLEHLNAKEQETVDLIQRVAQRVPAVQRPPQPPLEGDAADTYATHTDAIDQHLATLSRLHVPSLFVGIRPYLIVAVALILAAMIAQWQTGQFPQRLAGLQTIQPQWREIGIATGATFGGLLVLGLALWLLARSQVRRAYAPLRQSLDRARHAAQTIYENAKAERDHKLARASKKRDLEVHAAKAKFEPMLSRARQNRDSAMRSIDGEYSRRITRIGSPRDSRRAPAADRAEVPAWPRRTAAAVAGGAAAHFSAN
jgi:DNA segregation ATPase FtsK/SpoIIIE, S-DNA-T family